MSANVRGDNSNGSGSIKDGLSSFDFSGIWGAEYFFPIGVGISIRYQLGFSNIFSRESVNAFNQSYGADVTVKNQALIITLRYRF